MSAVTIAAPALRDWARRILEAAGAPGAAADLVAATLVAANLRGVDSHGVQLLLFYVEKIENGRVNVNTSGRVISESGACLLYDGENGLGQVISDICAGHAVRLARAHGLGMAVARESNHFGAAAWWADRIASHGMIGVVTCNASPMVAPWQGCEPRFGTNPICVAVPSAGSGAWLLDMATTTVAMGRIYGAMVRGEASIPAGWALDNEGVPTTSTETALAGLLMPLGGYKGSGLAMMAEILAGVLSGGAISTELGGLRVDSRPFRVSQTFLAIDVARFLPLEEFQARMEKLVAMVKSSRPARGYDEVMVAGDPEWRHEAVRSRDGVPVAASLYEKLVEISERLGVDVPG
jgi:LDH2 family malate/lactate/ureidoglycolate dehydrogenase